jgi:orotate phosphoribosyltransferase
MASNLSVRRQICADAIVRSGAFARGDFTLASGQKSSYYIDLSKCSLNYDGLGYICDAIQEVLDDWGFPLDAVAGPMAGADPIVGALIVRGLAYRGGLVRKEPKKNSNDYVEGAVGPGDGVVLIEDVTTTGASAMRAAEILEKERECTVLGIVSIVDRLQGARELFENSDYEFLSVLTIKDLGVEL